MVGEAWELMFYLTLKLEKERDSQMVTFRKKVGKPHTFEGGLFV